MNTTDGSGLLLPRCCAHLMSSWGDGPYTAVTRYAAPSSLPSGPRPPRPDPTAESGAFPLPGNRVLDA
ncbi:hypothetical protein B046DRAFT_00029 [Streptomyces sp. LamerLS-316]|nr:hypothetical protein B046DRAFT_00029 [Streptomyces sp. LamerLS-316]